MAHNWPSATSEPIPMCRSLVPMVPMPAAGGSALGRYLRFLVLERERDKEIELER